MTEQEVSRNAARRLAIIRYAQEVTGNVALTCRYYGITRQKYYIWLRRYEQFGVDSLRDRTSRLVVGFWPRLPLRCRKPRGPSSLCFTFATRELTDHQQPAQLVNGPS